MRITLLTGAMIVVVSMLLTCASMYNAGNRFYSISDEWNKSNEKYEVMVAEKLIPVSIPEDATRITTFAGINSIPQDSSQAAANRESASPETTSIASMAVVTPATMTIKMTKQFNYWSYIYTILIAGAGMIFSWIVAGRALRPVQKLSELAVNIGENGLGGRIPVGESRDEVGELTRAFNAMLNQLEASFERQKQFSSNVAHELKTPLATLKMSLQIGQMEEDPGTMAIAERNVDRLIHIVDELLMLTNEGTVAREDAIELSGILREVAEEIQPLYQDKCIAVAYDLQVSPVVKGDFSLVRRLFFNLIENGMKYNRQGGTLGISINTSDKDYIVAIQDDGPGIESENHEHIFEPFYCVDPSRSRQLGGAGLGLSIVRAAAECHSWEVSVDSIQGEGSTFTVRIPSEERN